MRTFTLNNWNKRVLAALVTLCFCVNATAFAEEKASYYRVDLLALEYENGKIGSVAEEFTRNREKGYFSPTRPVVQVIGEGEVFPLSIAGGFNGFWTTATCVIRTPHARKVRGTVHWFVGRNETRQLQFEIDASESDSEQRNVFWQKRADFYRTSMRWGGGTNPGAAWFRHQYRQSLAQIDKDTVPDSVRESVLRQQRSINRVNNERAFALVTGGRAISENLQLQDPLFVRDDQELNVDIDSLEGITVREYDWETLVEGMDPAKDVLAHAIPFDQHGVFFRSFQGVVDLVDQMKSQGSDFVMLANAGGQDAETREFYERQLCVSLDSATRILGSQMIKSVAMTGGDLYLRTGSDVALLLEPTEAGQKALLPLLVAQIKARAMQNGDAEPVAGTQNGIKYSGFRSADRRISTYMARIGETVVITNSMSQLSRLNAVATKQTGSLADLDEYTFFRDRYRIETPEETAFVFISDATIRRWCGAQWRIATARRTRAVAKMSEIQAHHMDHLVNETVKAGAVESDLTQFQAGSLSITPVGVMSDIYGSLEFQTPISELEIEKVSKAEANGYRRWREGYQSRWRNFFDPIGIQVSLSEGVFASDVSVMPLIAGSDYRELIELSQGVLIGNESGDPHKEAIGHAVLALNHESRMLRQLNSMAGTFAPGLQVDIFSWIGDSVSIYADADPFWDEWIEVAKTSENGRGFESRESNEFLQDNLNRLPVAVRVEVASGFKLGLFLAALRGFTESAAPGLLSWETLKHNEQPYVAISPSAIDDGIPEDFRIYYLATGKQLLLTLHKDMVHRAIDREKARAAGTAGDDDNVNWYGSNFGVRITEQMKHLYMPLIEVEMPDELRRMSWRNLAILNEWKRKFPDRDPVEIHREFWQRRLICPGGGEYVWNAKMQQMESTVFGSPVNPKMPAEPPVPRILRNLKSGEFGVSFEDDGVRAKVRLELSE